MAINRTDNPANAELALGTSDARAVGCWGGCWSGGCWGGCWPGVAQDVTIREEILRQLSDLQDSAPKGVVEGKQAIELLAQARRNIKAGL